MRESLDLRKKIDEMQREQNQKLIDSLTELRKESNSDVSTKNSQAHSFSSSQSGIMQNTPNPDEGVKHMVLGTQSFDLIPALNILMNVKYPGSNQPMVSPLPQQSFMRISDYEQSLTTPQQTNQSSNTLSQILNIMTQKEPIQMYPHVVTTSQN